MSESSVENVVIVGTGCAGLTVEETGGPSGGVTEYRGGSVFTGVRAMRFCGAAWDASGPPDDEARLDGELKALLIASSC